jgi:hypothetical protein
LVLVNRFCAFLMGKCAAGGDGQRLKDIMLVDKFAGF